MTKKKKSENNQKKNGKIIAVISSVFIHFKRCVCLQNDLRHRLSVDKKLTEITCYLTVVSTLIKHLKFLSCSFPAALIR